MKHKIIRGLILLFAVYAVMFAGKLIYNLFKPENYNQSMTENISFDFAKSDNRKNYQTEQQVNSAGSYYEEKYEQVSQLDASTEQFEEHKTVLFEIVDDFGAVIQAENTVENRHYKRMFVKLGIVPEKFTEFIDTLKKKIEFDRITINKIDKTNEYREMLASRESLIKNRDSLLALKKQQGKIEEYIKLEDKLLEIERQIQALGVNLGDFDPGKSLSTVNISLTRKGEYSISIGGEIVEAASWAFMTYAGIIVIVLFSVLFVFLSIVVYDKAKKYAEKYSKEKRK